MQKPQKCKPKQKKPKPNKTATTKKNTEIQPTNKKVPREM